MIVGLSIGPRMDADNELLVLEYSMLYDTIENPILPDLPQRLTLKELREGRSQAVAQLAKHREAMLHLRHIKKELSGFFTGDGQTNLEEYRRFLELWFAHAVRGQLEVVGVSALAYGQAEIIDGYPRAGPDGHEAKSFLKAKREALRQFQPYEAAYVPHPYKPDRGEERARNRVRYLAQLHDILEEFNQKQVGALVREMLRRGDVYQKEAERVIEELGVIVRVNAPDYLCVDVILMNGGSRPYCATTPAALRLSDKAFKDREAPLTMHVARKGQPIVTVAGHAHVLLRFYSSDHVDSIEFHEGGKRLHSLRELFVAGNATCHLVLATVGDRLKEGEVSSTGVPFASHARLEEGAAKRTVPVHDMDGDAARETLTVEQER